MCIYIYRERERDIDIDVYVCIYLYIFIYLFKGRSRGPMDNRRCENMVGVNMALAELIRFKHGLYRSCGMYIILRYGLYYIGYHIV